jgi:hypothetical protein
METAATAINVYLNAGAISTGCDASPFFEVHGLDQPEIIIHAYRCHQHGKNGQAQVAGTYRGTQHIKLGKEACR